MEHLDVQLMIETLRVCLEKMRSENDIRPILIAGEDIERNSIFAKALHNYGRNTELINVPHAKSLGIKPEKLMINCQKTYIFDEADGYIELFESSRNQVEVGGLVIILLDLKSAMELKLAISKRFRVFSLTRQDGLCDYKSVGAL